MPELSVQIKADLSNYIAGMKQAGAISATAASEITKQLSRVTQAQTDLGGSTMSTSMKFMQMRSGLSAARDGLIGVTMTGQRADSALMAMGHHFTTLVSETGSLGGAFKALGASLMGIGGVILAITLAFEIYKHLQKEANDETKDYVSTLGSVREAQLKGQQDGANEITRLQLLYRATQDHTLSLADRNLAYDELDRKYPKYFTNADREKTLLGDNEKAYYALANSILAAANAKAYEAQIGENSNRAFEDQQKINDEVAKYNTLIKKKAESDKMQEDAAKNGGQISFISISKNNRAIEASRKALQDLYGDQTKLFNANEKLKNMALDSETKSGFKSDQGGKDKAIKEQVTGYDLLQQKVKDYEGALKDLVATNASPTVIDSMVAELEKAKTLLDAVDKRIKDVQTIGKGAPNLVGSNPTAGSIADIKIAGPAFGDVSAMADGAKKRQEYIDWLAESKARQDEMTASTKEEGKAMKGLTNLIGGGLSNAFQSALAGTQSFASAFGQFIVGLIEKLIAAIAAAAILAALLAFTPLGGIMGVATGAAGFTTNFASGLSGLTHLADGGITNGPTRALIGEGREKEAVMPLSKLQSFVNGGGGNQGTIMHKIEGPDLLIWIDRANKSKTRVG